MTWTGALLSCEVHVGGAVLFFNREQARLRRGFIDYQIYAYGFEEGYSIMIRVPSTFKELPLHSD